MGGAGADPVSGPAERIRAAAAGTFRRRCDHAATGGGNRGCAVEDFRTVARLAFGQRRKMLRSSLAGLGDSEALLSQVGIQADRRAENLSVADFARLAGALGQRAVRCGASSR